MGAGGSTPKVLVVGTKGAGKSAVIAQRKSSATAFNGKMPPGDCTYLSTSAGKGFFAEECPAGDAPPAKACKGAKAVVFVVDGTDKDATQQAKKALQAVFTASPKTPILILVNKHDQKNAMPGREVGVMIGMDKIKGGVFNLKEVSATAGDGMSEAFEWLEAKL